VAGESSGPCWCLVSSFVKFKSAITSFTKQEDTPLQVAGSFCAQHSTRHLKVALPREGCCCCYKRDSSCLHGQHKTTRDTLHHSAIAAAAAVAGAAVPCTWACAMAMLPPGTPCCSSAQPCTCNQQQQMDVKKRQRCWRSLRSSLGNNRCPGFGFVAKAAFCTAQA
jgi:hypothetical protein